MMIDIHNHIFKKIDDGPKTEQDTIDLLHQAVENGITDIIITPHHHSGDYLNPSEKIIEALDELKTLITELEIDVRIYAGQEIRINPNIIEELINGESMTLNHSKYVLIEFPNNEYFSETNSLIFDLQMNSYIPIIAHVERCRPLTNDIEVLYRLINKGAIIQVTAGSVTGFYGAKIKDFTLKMIKHNIVHVVASDAHHANIRPFMLHEAYTEIEEKIGKHYVDYLKKNAYAILHDEEVTVISPVRSELKNAFKKRQIRNIWGLF